MIQTTNTAGQPVDANLDLGELTNGAFKDFEVKIANTYLSPKLVTTQFSCGACTHLISAPEVIPPGREGIFKFRFAPTSSGTQMKTIFFQIDGKTEVEFHFIAQVK